MKTLYVRIKPKTGADGFFRCGKKFTMDWRKLDDVDDATAKRLEEEQMLQVSEDVPADFDSGSSAADAAQTSADEPAESDGGTSAADDEPAPDGAAQTTPAKAKKGGK